MGVCPWESVQYVSQLTSCSPPAQTPHKLIMARPRHVLSLMSRPSQDGIMISPESSGHYDVCYPGHKHHNQVTHLGPGPTVSVPWPGCELDLHLAALLEIFTSSRLCHAEPESSKAATLKRASLGALHAVSASCSPGAHAHLQRLLKQQAPHCPQLW